MEHVIAGGILEAFTALALGAVVLGALSATLEYLRDHRWPLWLLVGLVGPLVYVTHAGLWGYVWDHVGLIVLGLFLGAPVALAAVTELEARAQRRHKEARNLARARRGTAKLRL
ncbi:MULTISPECIES: hypothetical protein [unclassified Bradyrhizobium]|uniref:hypothetical protein n=1 Tax=unclassified Bradyrhizobium TaxID=2631580 RepID=UPI00211ED8D6|nr:MULTISPECIES: hypothetical protein [unclassified Bradyrhizobium]MDD1531999.1 hypothetical protein [Bradyrhizobium sp. WBOS8]MDD1585040.1 hypothetical protein [Bradyrhizobium sp. WBOS4]UUO46129.1 hypothetical protein DCM78_03765 [Bradyrhizobium sp. WBOS04]UUO60091.1 hypothetical protein DCM80_13455 [Bradyrhizobium sp. WBOS08]